ncbi:MAG: hypothetical protein ABFR95_09230 [Actinomycetota bacterium]
MSSLDTLARESSQAVHKSVAGLSAPTGAFGGAVVASGIRRTFTYAVAGAAAGMVAVFALLILSPTDTPPTVSSVTTTMPNVTTSIPDTVTPTTSPAPDPGTRNVPPPAEQGNPSAAADTTPPELIVLSPADGERLKKEYATFEGKTEPGAEVVASGKYRVDVAADGAWSIGLVLSPGGNGVVFEATDEAGNVASVRMIIYYDAETTTTTKPVDYPFTAYQKYGTSTDAVPWDKFYGKSAPGAKIAVTSEFGGGSTVANGDGQWELIVQFPGAPYDKTFTVKVKDDLGRFKHFSFVSKYTG